MVGSIEGASSLNKMFPSNYCNAKDTITSNEDDSLDISVPTYIDKKGDYELSKDACVASFTYRLKFLQDVVNELYVFNIYLISNE